MAAQEFMESLRRRSLATRGIIQMPTGKIDQGTLVDQLWEEQGFYASKDNGVLVSVRRALEHHEDYYEFECLEFVEGEVRYWKYVDKDSIHVDPQHLEMMLDKREGCKIDYPVSYLESSYGGYRWGVEEHPDCDGSELQFFYQEHDVHWGKKMIFDYIIGQDIWQQIKKSAKRLFDVFKENADGGCYTLATYQIFDEFGTGTYCVTVREHSDCEDCLELVYQEKSTVKGRGYETSSVLPGAFDEKEWARFEAFVDAYIAKL